MGSPADPICACAASRRAAACGRIGVPPDEPALAEAREAAFAVAYRMMGSVADAEDVVQDALVRLHQALEAGEEVRSTPALATTIATRLAINALTSARARREQYVGEWLPEPVLAGGEDDPADAAERSDTLSLALLLVLEALTPQQRAAFLLHDVFGYEFGEVADAVGVSAANARQLASRARRHVLDQRPRYTASPEQRDRLAAGFFAAARDGDVAALEALLAEDVVLYGDGGGKAPALARPATGRARVARTLGAWSRAGQALARWTPRTVNGHPGAVISDLEGRTISVIAIEVDGARVVRVYSIVNPDKLRHLGPPADVYALLRARRDRADHPDA